MDKSTSLAILGTVATVVLGGWSIYLALKRRYPGRISFLKESSVGLFDSIVRNLPELSILYKDAPVSPNLVLLKGFLQNTGSIDVTEEMVEDKLTLSLPEGYKWLTGKVVATSPQVHATINITKPTDLAFDLGLFRCEEYIRFEALTEVPIPESEVKTSSNDVGKRVGEVLTITHRIANTQKVIKEEIDPGSEGESIRLSLSPFVLNFLALAVCLMGLFYIFIELRSQPLIYIIQTKQGELLRVYKTENEDSSIDLTGIDTNYHEHVSDTDFYLRRYKSIGTQTWRETLTSWLRSSLYSLPLAFTPVFIAYVYTKRRKERLRKLFST